VRADQPTGKHPFDQARETWEAWSMANTMRLALRKARERGDHQALARFGQYPEWTQGPTALQALAANRELVDILIGWRWSAVRDAREHGHAWAEIGQTLGVTAEQARQDYLDRVEQQRSIADRYPDLAPLIDYQPGLVELAEPNPADRAHQRQGAEREVGREG
jgi:hypothetical protein